MQTLTFIIASLLGPFFLSGSESSEPHHSSFKNDLSAENSERASQGSTETRRQNGPESLQLSVSLANSVEELRRRIEQFDTTPSHDLASKRLRWKLVTEYLSLADRLESSGTTRLPQQQFEYYLKLRDEAIEHAAKSWFNAEIPTYRGQKLASYRGWIYYKEKVDVPYEKILPGICPQWAHDDNQDAAAELGRCYVFLQTGLEREVEMWSVDIRNKLYLGRVGRLTNSINNSPIISPSGTHFVHVVNPVSISDGAVYLIRYFERSSKPSHSGEMVSSERLLFETREGSIHRLKWVDEGTVSFLIQNSETPNTREVRLKVDH